MGMLDKVTGVFSGGEEDEQSEEEVLSEELDAALEPEPDPEPKEPEPEPEWESATDFTKDVLGELGFTNLSEFTLKAMAYRVDKSPMYRDQLQTGMQTIDSVTTTMESLQEVQGSGGSDSIQEQAEKVKGANDLIDEVDKLNGREEEIIQETISVARDFVDNMNSGGSGAGTRSIDSSMGTDREEF